MMSVKTSGHINTPPQADFTTRTLASAYIVHWHTVQSSISGHVLFICLPLRLAWGLNVFSTPTSMEGARLWNVLDRCHARRWSYCPLHCSLLHKSIPQATSRSSWLPDHRKCSRTEIKAIMAQVRRLAKEVWSVCFVFQLSWQISDTDPIRWNHLPQCSWPTYSHPQLSKSCRRPARSTLRDIFRSAS